MLVGYQGPDLYIERFAIYRGISRFEPVLDRGLSGGCVGDMEVKLTHAHRILLRIGPLDIFREMGMFISISRGSICTFIRSSIPA